MPDLFDANCMIGRWATEALGCGSADQLLAEMDRLGIERALVSHTLAWHDSPTAGNARLMAEIAAHPRLEPCWVVMPGHQAEMPGGVAGLMAELSRAGVRAVRICPRDHVYPLAAWMVGDLLGPLNDRRYVLLMDPDQVVLPTGLFDVNPEGWQQIEWLCRTYPDLAVVLTRVGYRALRVLLPLLITCHNLSLDLSYFATHEGVEVVAREIGADRLLFGTGQPQVDPGGALARFYYSALSAEQRDLVGHGNLDRLLDRVTDVRPRGQAARSPASARAAQAPGPDDLPALCRAGQSLSASGLDIVDAHAHLGPYRNFYIPDPSASAIVRLMDRCGVARLCLAAHRALAPDWISGNRLTADAVAAFPDRLIGQASASPHEPEQVGRELRYLFEDCGFRAIKLHPDLFAHPIAGAGFVSAWEFAAERRCPVFCHTYHGSRFCDPQMFGSLADLYPDVPIVLVHSGAQTAAFAGAIALAQQHDNLYLDISGSFITGAWIRRMVRDAGADRVIFSSDIPFIDMRYTLGRVVFAGLSRAEQTLVLGGNARRLLGLPRSG